MVELRTLGGVELLDAGRREIRAVLAQPKRLVLLAYLALSSRGRYRSRDTLRALFWPDLDDAHARNALSQAGSFLRRHLGEDAILRRGNDELAVDIGKVICDAVAFENAVDRNDLESASALYRGAFLDGVFVSDASAELESWLAHERDRLGRLAAHVEARLSERAFSEGDAVAAERHARAAALMSPDDEHAHRQLIDVLARSGERAEAIKVYQTFAQHMEREYHAQPSSETRAAARAAHLDRDLPLAASGSGVSALTEREALDRSRANASRPSRIGVLSAVTAAAVGLLAIGAAWSAEHLPPPIRLDANLIAVAPFDVIGSRNRDLREGLLDLVSASLDGAGPIRAIPASRVLKLWQGRADTASAAALARATRAGLVLYGRVVTIGGDSVRVNVSLVDATTGATREFEVRDDVNRLDRISDTLTVALLRDLGRSRPIGAVRAVSLGSTSHVAMRAFLRGEQFFRRNLADSATANYARAVELDGQFALAWRRLGAVRAWGRWETDSLVVLYRSRAASLNVGLPARESLLVVADSLYQALAEQGRNAHWAEHHRRLYETLASATARYADDAEIWYTLGLARTYFPLDSQGMRAAFEAFDHALALDSAYLPAYEHPALLSLSFDQPDDAWRYLAARRRNDSSYASSEGARLVERLIDPSLRPRARAQVIARASPTALSEAAFALDYWRDSTETNVLLRRELLQRNRPAELGDREAYVETLFDRGHPAAALAAAKGNLDQMNNVALMHLALVGAVPEQLVDARVDKVFASGRVTSIGLPLWAARRDTAAIVRFQRAVKAQSRLASLPAPPVSPASFERSRRYTLARASAYSFLARGDSAGAVQRFALLADPECAGCSFTAQGVDRLILARLLSSMGRYREAFSLIQNSNWFGIPASPFDVEEALEIGRLAQRLGERDRAIRAYQYVVHRWPHADPTLWSYVTEATRALESLSPR